MATHLRIEEDGYSNVVAMSSLDGFRIVDSGIPLKLLEQAIAACVGRKMLSMASRYPRSSIGGMTVSISEETVRMRSTASEGASVELERVVQDCYILQQLTLPKELIFTCHGRRVLQWE